MLLWHLQVLAEQLELQSKDKSKAIKKLNRVGRLPASLCVALAPATQHVVVTAPGPNFS